MQEIVGSIPVGPNKRLTLVFAATQLSSLDNHVDIFKLLKKKKTKEIKRKKGKNKTKSINSQKVTGHKNVNKILK
jgi:hypothetical protein